MKEYTIYIGRDPFADPQRYPNGIAYLCGIRDENGEKIDGEGDLPDYETAKDLLFNALHTLMDNE